MGAGGEWTTVEELGMRPVSLRRPFGVPLSFSLSLLILLAPVSGRGQETSPEPPERGGPSDPLELGAFLDGVMKIQLDEHSTAGAVVSVVKDGQLFFSKGYGYADYEARKPVDPGTTLFRIGSVSKLFVWTSVMQLVEEGLLDLDTDINEYLEGFQIPDTYPEPITLKHVLTHSAGFEDYVVGLFGRTEADRRPLGKLLADQIPARVRPPGEVSSYSNHATGMAAYIVETVSGVPWDEFVQERILDPLGMEYFSFAQPLPEALEEHMSKGYVGHGEEFTEKEFELVPLYPVGAAAASGEAMAKFMVAHLHLGDYGEGRILSEETSRLMQSDLFTMAPGVNAALHGFYEKSDNGERIIGHGGDTFWFHSDLALFPEHDLGIFVSYNSEDGGAAKGGFIDAFVDRYFPVEEVLPEAPEDFSERGQRFTGSFRANRFSHTSLAKVGALGDVKVRLTEDNTLKALGKEWIEIAPLTFQEKYGDETLHFREGEGGKITHMFRGGVPIMAFERIPLSEKPMLHYVLFGIFGVLMMGTVLALPWGWAARKWYGVDPESLDRLPRRARLSLWWAGVFYLAFTIGLMISLSQPSAIAEEITLGLKLTLLIPFVGALFTLASVWFAMGALAKGQGRVLSRILYSGTTLSFCLFLWQLHVWNLLGWRF
jgi:CubicO group peptidase (beta-lactamase class C family)